MSMTINGTSGLTFNDASTQNTAATGFGFKNRLINGACMIDQRNAGASVTLAASGYTLDRWRAGMSLASKFSVQQNAGSVAPPEGFTNYLGVTSLSSYAIAASEIFNISQRIEGFNTADLGFGTATAKAVTLSFLSTRSNIWPDLSSTYLVLIMDSLLHTKAVLIPNACRLATTLPAIPLLVSSQDGLNTGTGASGANLTVVPYTNLSIQVSPITKTLNCLNSSFLRLLINFLFNLFFIKTHIH
jgi:hypothetical protein